MPSPLLDSVCEHIRGLLRLEHEESNEVRVLQGWLRQASIASQPNGSIVDEVVPLLQQNQKIMAIKRVREIYMLPLREAKALVESILESRSHQIRNPELDIATLIREDRKIDAIRTLRSRSGIGLREAKEEIDRKEDQMITEGDEAVFRNKVTRTMGFNMSGIHVPSGLSPAQIDEWIRNVILEGHVPPEVGRETWALLNRWRRVNRPYPTEEMDDDNAYA